MSHTHGPDGSDGPGEEQVGSVGEEAAKLFGAMTDAGWAAGLAALAGQAAEGLRDVDRAAEGPHRPSEESECRWCPFCRAVHLVRETSPEVRDQLVSAGRSLLQAATLLLDHAAGPAGGRRAAGVERIDLDHDVDDASSTPEEDW